MQEQRKLAVEIRQYCEAHANPKQAAKWARFFTEGYDAWGFDPKHPFFTEKQPEWRERYAKEGLPWFLKLGEVLVAGSKYEEIGLAILLVRYLRSDFDQKTFAQLDKWFNAGIANWAHTDVLCREVIGPLLISGQVKLKDIESWRNSKLKYQRRAVPVALVEMVKAGHKIPPLLDFIRPLMMDDERVVQQGLGWLLRDAWKKDPKPVEAFLLGYKDTAPRLIIQYATEKMTVGARAKFRAEKKPKTKSAKSSV
jgi:3-methyladenine DNA glycosylase AlkD